MTRTEVIELVDKIQIYRPYFRSRLGDKVYQDLLVEWSRILEPYDYEDIQAKLEDFLKDENNYGKEPDVYQLIKGVLTIKDKENGGKCQIACQFCGRYMAKLELDAHEERCRSIKYLQRLYRNYLKREIIDKKELYDMGKDNFNKAYIRVLEKVLPLVTDNLEKRGITNVIETYYGRPPKYTYREVIGNE